LQQSRHRQHAGLRLLPTLLLQQGHAHERPQLLLQHPHACLMLCCCRPLLPWLASCAALHCHLLPHHHQADVPQHHLLLLL
jgi:hypothetical protein